MTIHDDKSNEVPAPAPPEAPKPGRALKVALAAIARLADLRRPRARVLHHRRPSNGREGVSGQYMPRSSSYNTEPPG